MKSHKSVSNFGGEEGVDDGKSFVSKKSLKSKNSDKKSLSNMLAKQSTIHEQF